MKTPFNIWAKKLLLAFMPVTIPIWASNHRCALPGDNNSHRNLSKYLREPLATTRALVQKNTAFLNRIDAIRTERFSIRELQCLRHRLVFENRLGFSELCRQHTQSRILASFHFGDFILGLHYLMSLDSKSRKRFLLSQNKNDEILSSNIASCLQGSQRLVGSQLLVSEHDCAGLASKLREGGSTLVLFCDLPREFGETVGVNFLGRSARFPKGPATLAITSRVPILPAISFEKAGRKYIELGRQIETSTRIDETLAEAVTRITQELVSFFEAYFVRFPEQWRYLQRLPSYYGQIDAVTERFAE